jgi:hypothetical protein
VLCGGDLQEGVAVMATNDELRAAVNALTDFTARHLPEGYAVRLGVSASGSAISVCFDDANDVRWVLPINPDSWGAAVDAAKADAKRRAGSDG